jgi:zinc protease
VIPAGAVRAVALRSLVPGRVAIGVAGAIDRAATEASLRELTAGWSGPAPTASTPAPSTSGPAAAERLVTIEGPGLTTWLALGHVVPAIAPADQAAMAVLGEILNIRLNIATREMRGLTNRALLEYPAPGHGAGLLHVRSGGRPESVAPLLVYALEELTHIREPAGAPTVDELAQAQGGLALGAWQGSLDGARRTAATWATETVRHGSLDRLLGWPEAVRAVTAVDVQRVARQVIDPARLCAVVIGRIDEVERARHPRWPFTLDDVRARLRAAR